MTYYPALGVMIREEMDRKDLSASFLGRRLYEHLNFPGPQAAYLYVSTVRKGSIYGSTSRKSREKPINTERLSILLFAIGFAENNQLIQVLRQENKNFIYPPSMGVPYEALKKEGGESIQSSGLEDLLPNL